MKKIWIVMGAILSVMGVVLIALGMTTLKNRGELDVRINVKEAIMPIAYKVYADPSVENGKYYLAKTIFYNKGKGKIKNLKISYRVPGFIEWTTPYRYEEILPGQTVVNLFYPKFSSKILDILNTTPASVEIRYRYSDGVKSYEMIKRRNFQIRGRNEMIYTDMPPEEISDIPDLYTNVNLLACFVTPEDPVIKYFTQQLQKKVLKGSTAGAGGGEGEIVRFMRGLYEFERAAGIVYGGTLGLPEKIGNKVSVVQHIRLPREVLTGGSGLCVELSTLFGSVAASAGLNPVIFVTQNHAFPGILAGNDVIAIEATGIGGEGLGGSLSFEKAVEVGTKNANSFLRGEPVNGAMPIAVLNINQLHAKGYRPPDLQDDANLRKKIDSIFERLIPKTQGMGAYPGQGYGGAAAQGPAISAPAPKYGGPVKTYRDPGGLFSFSYPANWELVAMPLPALPSLRVMVGDPAMTYQAEVYVLDGVQSVDQAIGELYTTLTQMGEKISYTPLGEVSINGVRFKRYTGITQGDGAVLHWAGYFTNTGRGVVGFFIGSYQDRLDVPELLLIKESFKVGR